MSGLVRWTVAVVAVLAVGACGSADNPTAPATPSDPATAEPDARTVRCTQEYGDTAVSPYTLPFPVGRTYRLIQGACPPNPAWGHHNWIAYDFNLQIGDTVLASRAGEVIAVGDSFADATRVCGEENWIFIRHADGTVMQYVHLTRGGARVDAGQRVEAGQFIALSGDSGCSSGPHLHVALFRDATSFDAQNNIPLNYRRAKGPLNVRHALMQDQEYTALP